jgi:hypothetical protein
MELATNLHLMPRSGKSGAVPPLTPFILMAWSLISTRDNFTSLPFNKPVKVCNFYDSGQWHHDKHTDHFHENYSVHRIITISI